MPRRPRAWRITMWTSLAATVLLAGGAIWSRARYDIWFDAEGRGLGIWNGCLTWGKSTRNAGRGWMQQTFKANGPIVWWEYTPTASGWGARCSFWLPAGATFAVSSLSAFMVYRARRRPGHCPCGYNLSGLSQDIPCPECGRPPSHIQA